METVNDRIECVVNEFYDGKKASFANAIGIDRFTIANYLGPKKRSKPSVDMLAKMVKALNVDAYWLLTGEGEMLKGAPAEQSIVVRDLTHVEGPTKPEPADTAVLRARLAAAEDLVQALRAQLMEKEQTAAALRQIIDEKQKLINLLEAR